MGLDIVLLEVTDSDSIKKAVEKVTEATGGKLDILINNSGVGSFCKLRPRSDMNVNRLQVIWRPY